MPPVRRGDLKTRHSSFFRAREWVVKQSAGKGVSNEMWVKVDLV